MHQREICIFDRVLLLIICVKGCFFFLSLARQMTSRKYPRRGCFGLIYIASRSPIGFFEKCIAACRKAELGNADLKVVLAVLNGVVIQFSVAVRSLCFPLPSDLMIILLLCTLWTFGDSSLCFREHFPLKSRQLSITPGVCCSVVRTSLYLMFIQPLCRSKQRLGCGSLLRVILLQKKRLQRYERKKKKEVNTAIFCV